MEPGKKFGVMRHHFCTRLPSGNHEIVPALGLICQLVGGEMSRTKAILVAILMLLAAAPASAALNPLVDLVSLDSVMRWINAYRTNPDPAGVPAAVKALSRFGSFKDPEQSGVFVGFLAGVIATNPEKADQLINKMLPLPPGDQWVVVRAIAYSGHPDWRNMLRRFTAKLPARQVMIDKYLTGQLPRLYQYQREPAVSTWDTVKSKVTGKELPKAHVLEPSPELLDTYWGYYFATGHARPISRIIEMLPWSLELDSVDKLTLGSMAKYTLASNASRDPELLVTLRETRERSPKETAKVLTQVIDAADTVDTAKLRKEAMAAIEELRRKGPAYRRNVSWWGQIGQGALAVGCIAAAATGQIYLGLPCVITGGVSSAALSSWEKQQ